MTIAIYILLYIAAGFFTTRVAEVLGKDEFDGMEIIAIVMFWPMIVLVGLVYLPVLIYQWMRNDRRHRDD